MQTPNTYRAGPDPRGHFGIYGGRYVAETLMPLILAVEQAYNAAQDDPNFHAELAYYLEHYVGRPSPLYFAERLTRHFGGAKLYFKRDELNHTGAHKINNVLGQILLARRMGKRRIIAETGAGQHGVATATACALFDLPCVVYMGATDIERQKPNVFRMRLLGRRGRAGAFRHRDAEGRDERRAARLGRACRRHVLRDRHGRGAASLPGDGARLPVGDRPRDARADDESRGAAARHAGRLHRRRLERDGAVPPVSRRSVGAHDRRRGRRARHRDRAARGLAERRPARRAARQPHLSAAERRRPDQRRAFDLGRARLSRHRARSTPGCTISAASNTSRSPTARRSTPSSCAAARKGSSRRWSRRTRWRMSRRSPRPCRATTCS